MQPRHAKQKFAQVVKKYTHNVIPYILVFLIAFVFGAKFDEFNFSFSSQNEGLPANLDYSSVDKVYDELRDKFDGKLSEQQLLDGLKKGLVEATGDPYTSYFTEEESKEFEATLNGQFTGIGAELGKRDDQIVIIAPLDGFPAKNAGLMPGDAILAVNGEDATDWTIEQAVSKIRGEKGTKVTLTIVRGDETKDITIVRDEIVIPSVEYEIKDNTGYIQITRFADDTSQSVRQAAQEMKDKNVKGVVLDLRGNGGGYLQSAVDVASLWLDDKVVVEERDGDKVLNSQKSSGDPILLGMPTVVLIDEGSASASEIVAGALQDHGVATIVGAKSFGKGSVQQIAELDNGSQLKVTVARWYTPKGKNIDKEGITPDVKVDRTLEDAKANRDPQKHRAFEVLGE